MNACASKELTAGLREAAAAEEVHPLEEQLVRLMSDYERPLYAFVQVLVRDRDEARDCIQDTFVRAYETMRRGREVNKQWIYKVARNRAVDTLRQRQRVRPDLEKLEQELVPGPTDQNLIVRQALEELPLLDRKVLYLFTVVGLSSDEIAVSLGVQGAAIRQRLYRARNRFRLLYETAC
jgi:RNA polymerase sigma-70 factor (ECF subfamily)